MGDGCGLYWREQQRQQQEAREALAQLRRQMFAQIATPQVGDILNARTNDGGKTLVCTKRGIVACLAHGDRVLIFANHPGFAKTWHLPKDRPVEAVFGFGGDGVNRDLLIVRNGPSIPVQQLNRKIGIKVLSLVKRSTEPEYDEAAARETLGQLQLENELVPA